MLLSLLLLLFPCGSRAGQTATNGPGHTSSSFGVTSNSELRGTFPSPQLVATPNFPVAAGQAVCLQCSIVSGSASYIASFSWVWQYLENNTWNIVSNGTDLTLTKPSDSGLYRCLAVNKSSYWAASRNHTVFIVAVLPTEDTLGAASLVVSLLALIISVAVLFYLGWQKGHQTLPVSDTPKGAPGFKNTPNHPQIEDDNVYVNYRGPNCPNYTDLDPCRMAVASDYSTLS